MNWTSTAAARERSHPSFLLHWSDPRRSVAVDFIPEVIEAIILELPDRVQTLRGLTSGGKQRHWTVLACEPLPNSVNLRDEAPLALALRGADVVGLVIAESQRPELLRTLSSRAQTAAEILLVTVAPEKISVSAWSPGGGAPAFLTEFSASLEQFRRGRFHPFVKQTLDAPAAVPAREATDQTESSPREGTGAKVPTGRGVTVRFEVPPWVWAGALSLGALFVGEQYFTRSSRVAETPAAAEQPGQRVTFGFGIQAARLDKNLEIRWDPSVPSLKSAPSGVLKVADGDQVLAIPLSPSDLAAGRILYAPRTDSLGLELSVDTAGGPLSEKARIVLPAGAPVTVEQVRAHPPVPAPRREKSQPAKAVQIESQRVSPRSAATAPPAVEQTVLTAAVPPTSTPAAAPKQQPAAEERQVAAQRPPAAAAAEQPLPRSVTPSLPAPGPPPAVVKEAPREQAPAPAVSQPEPIRITSAVPLRQVAPVVPAALRNVMVRPVVISVTVRVDERGKVMSVRTPYYEGLEAHLADVAVIAARGWKFQPARKNDDPVASDYLIRFSFSGRR